MRFFICRQVAFEIVQFDGATRRVIGRTEIQDEPFAMEILEADGSAALGGQMEIGRRIADFENMIDRWMFGGGLLVEWIVKRETNRRRTDSDESIQRQDADKHVENRTGTQLH